MKIGIIGASGKAGRDIFAEAVRRGHETTALVRDANRAAEVLGSDAAVLERDAFDLTQADLAGFDVVVNAFGTTPDQAFEHVDLARHLVETVDAQEPRLVFILGAGSLRTGEDRHLFVEDIAESPGSEAWIAIPQAQLRELKYLRDIQGVNWVGISPGALFEPGPAAGVRLGKDELLADEAGNSRTSTGTMAIAVLDEIEDPAHRNTRFCVVDG
ncbi:NAD(P)-dependent oxidoreductase [Propionibacteriaceae bacterium Y1923]|uniref:NAD(P)-dependent oxidoreductase n=1 Tax=Aestuariimicrobium sp. Y1814 TaxID=3418742 RepID=UPI003C14DB01